MTKKDNKKAKILMAVFIAVIMIAGTIGYIFTDSGSNQKVPPIETLNGYKFYETDQGIYVVDYNGQLIPINYLPSQISDIEIQDIILNSGFVYLLYNPSSDVSIDWPLQKIASILTIKGTKVNLACTTEEKCGDIPVIKCNDKQSIIEFRPGNEIKIFSEDNCLVLEGSEEDINKLSDKIGLKLLGII